MATRRCVLGMATVGVIGGAAAAAATRSGRSAASRSVRDELVSGFYAPLQGADVAIYDALLDERWRCEAGSLRFGTQRASLGPAVRCFRSLLADARVELRRSSWDGNWLWVEGGISGRPASDVPGRVSCGAPGPDAVVALLEFVDLHRCVGGRILATRHYERPSPWLLECSHRLGPAGAGWWPASA